MSYICPKKCPSYLEYWNQYSDPIDLEASMTPIPFWISLFITITIIHQENCFFDTFSNMEWANKNFFPFIEEQREYFEYHGEAFVILDGFGPHNCDAF